MRSSILVLTLFVGSNLMAQTVRINGGAQVGLASPLGDFADKENLSGDYLGANQGLGLHVESQLNSVSVEAGGREGLGFDALTWISVTAVFRFGRP